MNLQAILNKFTHAGEQPHQDNNSPQASSSTVGSSLPNGLAGGAVAGGVMALLLGSKSTRKMAKKVATYGGTALLGGLAYKAYGNWQQNKALGQTKALAQEDIDAVIQSQNKSADSTPFYDAHSFSMTLIKTMIAATKADGEIDAAEHKRLFEAIDKANLSVQDKASIFDLLSREITIDEIVAKAVSDEQKAEIYLSAYLAIEVDDQSERAFLTNLGMALNLPRGLPAYLEQQADQGIID